MAAHGFKKGGDTSGKLTAKKSKLDAPGILNEHEADVWKYVAPILADMGVLSVADIPQVIMYCQNWVRLQKLNKLMEEEGYIVEEKTREDSVRQKPHPAFPMVTELTKLINKFCDNFGFHPYSRTKIPQQEEEDNDSDVRIHKFFTPVKKSKLG